MKFFTDKDVAFTKGRYLLGARCELALAKEIEWVEVNRINPVERTKEQWEIFHSKEVTEETLASKEGMEIGQLIYNHSKFKDGILIEDLGDKERTITQTNDILNSGEHVFLFEASFQNPDILGSYLRSDIIEVNEDGTLNLYEAKSSSNEKHNQIEDIAFQKYIIESCGYSVKNCFLAKLNKDYTNNGELVVEDLFDIVDVNDKVEIELSEKTEQNIIKCGEVYSAYAPSKTQEIGTHCKKGHECPFFAECSKNVESDSIHKLSGIRQNVRELLLAVDKKSMHDIDINPSLEDSSGQAILRNLNRRQKIQIENKQTKKDYLNPEIIKAFFTGKTNELCSTENADWSAIRLSTYNKAEKMLKDIMKNYLFKEHDKKNHIFEAEYNEEFLAELGVDSHDFYRNVSEYDFDTGGLITLNGRVRSNAYNDFKNCYLGSIISEKQRLLLGDLFKGLTYPLNHLDFEGRNFAIPRHVGMKCYEVYTYQASIHLETKKGELTHSDFLSTKEKDQRKELCKYLIKELGKNEGSIIVYYKSYEIGRLKDLQRWFPEYEQKLQGFIERIVDLDEITKRTWFYTESFNGSHSIKYVAPHFNPELSYEGMEVSNGFESMEKWQEFIYSGMQKNKKSQREVALRVYCKQDTFAMVTLINGMLALIGLPYNQFDNDIDIDCKEILQGLHVLANNRINEQVNNTQITR